MTSLWFQSCSGTWPSLNQGLWSGDCHWPSPTGFLVPWSPREWGWQHGGEYHQDHMELGRDCPPKRNTGPLEGPTTSPLRSFSVRHNSKVSSGWKESLQDRCPRNVHLPPTYSNTRGQCHNQGPFLTLLLKLVYFWCSKHRTLIKIHQYVHRYLGIFQLSWIFRPDEKHLQHPVVPREVSKWNKAGDDCWFSVMKLCLVLKCS